MQSNNSSVEKNLKDFEALLEKCTSLAILRQEQPRGTVSALQNDELQAHFQQGRKTNH